MDLWNILPALYVLSIIWAVVMTYREQRRAAHRNPVFNAIGFLACIVWPLVVTAVLILPGPDADYS